MKVLCSTTQELIDDFVQILDENTAVQGVGEYANKGTIARQVHRVDLIICLAYVIDKLQTQERFACAGDTGNKGNHVLGILFGVERKLLQTIDGIRDARASYAPNAGKLLFGHDHASSLHNGRKRLIARIDPGIDAAFRCWIGDTVI